MVRVFVTRLSPQISINIFSPQCLRVFGFDSESPCKCHFPTSTLDLSSLLPVTVAVACRLVLHMLQIKINWQCQNVDTNVKLSTATAHPDTHRYEMGTQPSDGVFGDIRSQLTNHRSEGVDANLFVALDQPVGQFAVHEHISPAYGVAIICLGLVLGYYYLDGEYLENRKTINVNGSEFCEFAARKTLFFWKSLKSACKYL